MKLKKKEPLQFRGLCALLLLIACCFRTAAVLGEQGSPFPPEYESFLFRLGQAREPHAETAPLPQKPLYLDPSLVDIDNRCGAVFDREALLQRPLSFSLSDDPCILIIHTHGSEAYGDCPGYRSTDPAENMIAVGACMAQRLNAAGIPTIQDTTLHDVTAGYNDAYEQAASAIEAYLEKYPSIQMVIDVHRDAAPDGQGGQKPLLTTLNGESAAQLMLVMGTDTPELPHKDWEQNLSLAVKLQAYFSTLAPDLMRQMSLRGSRYNQHLTPYSILLEVGSAGNSLEEALTTAAFTADSLAQLLSYDYGKMSI